MNIAYGVQGDETYRGKCPFCRANENSFRLNINDGVVYYKCYRNSCNYYGAIDYSSRQIVKGQNNKNKSNFKPKKYWGATHNLYTYVFDYMWQNFRIAQDTLRSRGVKSVDNFTDEDWFGILIPIIGPDKKMNGQTVRKYGKFSGPKSIIYNWVEELQGSWYHTPRSRRLFVVEDQISAIRIHQAHENALALLGTKVTSSLVDSIISEKFDSVIFMLDADASGDAIKIRQQFKLYNGNFSVKLLSKDPKDMNDLELHEVLYG